MYICVYEIIGKEQASNNNKNNKCKELKKPSVMKMCVLREQQIQRSKKKVEKSVNKENEFFGQSFCEMLLTILL